MGKLYALLASVNPQVLETTADSGSNSTIKLVVMGVVLVVFVFVFIVVSKKMKKK